jgi:hypothetical protein
MLRRSSLVALACILLACSLATAAAPLPASGNPTPLHRRIDHWIMAPRDFARCDAGPASDAEFLRRIYLDLIGTIPPAETARAFLRNPDAHKRQALIDELLASPAHARHLANLLDVMLMERRRAVQMPEALWVEYLRASCAANKPWDVLVREILSADGADPKTRPAARFLLDRGEPNLITRDISRLFLGTNLQCCQCHDHPRIDDYKQDHYYGLFAFIGRTSLVRDKAVGMIVLSEKADGETTFQSVFDPAKVTKTALPRVPGGPVSKDVPVEAGKAYVMVPSPNSRGVPRNSRRARLADSLARADYEPFRRNIANRLWAVMMGRGLIHPLDMDYGANPPSHPELLDELARDIAERKFEMRGFLREIALSQSYGRSSVLKPGVVEKEMPLYAAALLEPLTPEQFAWSLIQATGLTDSTRLSLGASPREEVVHARLVANVAPFVRAFASPPGTPAGFDATVDQALFLANGPLVRSWLAPRAGNLTDRLSRLTRPEDVADELYLSILTRLPDDEERQEVAGFLGSRSTDRPAALQDLAWALLTSAEFRFNH